MNITQFNKNIFLYIGGLLLLVCVSCSPAAKETSETKEDVNLQRVQLRKGLPATIAGYMLVKDALVASDSKLAKEHAQMLVSAIPATEIELIEITTRITQTEDIEKQREQLSALTDEVMKLVEAGGNGGQKLYYQHCPMAFDNLGASWLSTEKEIQNPYFGDRMLTCGRVEKEL